MDFGSTVALPDGTADTLRGVVVRGDVRAKLTEIERQLISYLASRSPNPISRKQLLVDVWGYAPTVRSRAADHTIARLRTKIEADPSSPVVLQTVHGVGYRWVAPAAVEVSAPVTTLRGRSQEDAELRQAAGAGLVLVVGPLGVGKSVLASQLGWMLIDLGGVRAVGHAATLVARALGVPLTGEPSAEQLVAALQARGGVVLDSVEPELIELVRAWRSCPVVVCSRSVLPAATTIRLGPLSESAAVELLAEHAAGAVHPSWSADLSVLARRLDRMPLALAVAGAAASWLSVDQVLAKLDEAPRVVLAEGGAWVPSVEAALGNISDEERALLEALCMFRHASLGAVDGLGGLAQLRGLVQRSLVWAEPGAVEVRYRVLRPVADVVLALARERGAFDHAVQAHLDWVLREVRARFGHPGHDVSDPRWWHLHLSEVFAAAERCENPADKALLALALVRLVGFGWIAEPLAVVQMAVAAAESSENAGLQCAALALRSRYDDATAAADLDAAEALAESPLDVAMVQHLRSIASIGAGTFELAAEQAADAVRRYAEAGCAQGELDALISLIDVLHPLGRGDEAIKHSARAIHLAMELDDQRGLGIAYAMRGYATPKLRDALLDQERALDALEAVNDVNAALRVRLVRARFQSMAGYETEDLAELVARVEALGQQRLTERAKMEAAAVALHEGDFAGALAWCADPKLSLEREGFHLLGHALDMAAGRYDRGVQGLTAFMNDALTASPTAGFYLAVCAMCVGEGEHEALAIWRESIESHEGHADPFVRFLGLYRSLATAFEALLMGGTEGLAHLTAADDDPNPLPAWLRQREIWSALLAGEEPGELPRMGPEGLVVAACLARKQP